ncbi:putative 2-dehydropantoate 2-reductase [Synechococcus sp. W65.1]|uniref:putative 2-dehydropantoate 2-reductase n=1 Tax=Synechococcus sp. W65.1 TaxID=2964526 RepID=UPI0039C32B9C
MSQLPESRRYAVLGSDAVGGFYGAKLQQAGFEVHFLLHSDYEQVRQNGLWVESCWGDFHLPQVNAYASVEAMPPCEGVIVALKATQNHLLPRLLPPVLAEKGVVILLQNGLGAEPEIANCVGPERVVGGLCFISSNKVGPGHIRHLDYGSVLLAEYGPGYAPQGITPRLQQIQADFRRAGIPTSLSPDLMEARWQKLVWNIPFNGLSVVFNADTQQMIRDPEARALAEALMQEVVEGAAACGRRLPPSLIPEMLANTEKMVPYRTSMKIDYERKRPLELEAIFANPLRYAQQAGVQMPRVEMLYRQLQVLDRLNRGIPAFSPTCG